mgnify:CR=1 FL=1
MDDNAALSEVWRESEGSMGLLYALESIRTPLLDKILGAVTYLGDELCFMVFAVGVFWCISKRMGYYLMTVGFFGTILNQFLKILCAIPRPWVKDPNFTIVESARAGASGYSFPSGHTQNAVTLYGGTARYTKTPWLRWVCIAVMVLICFSRMYLGVHTPLDVGVALAMGAVLVLALYPVMEEADRRPWVLTWVIEFMVVCSGAFVAYLYLRGDTGVTAEDTANLILLSGSLTTDRAAVAGDVCVTGGTASVGLLLDCPRLVCRGGEFILREGWSFVDESTDAIPTVLLTGGTLTTDVWMPENIVYQLWEGTITAPGIRYWPETHVLSDTVTIVDPLDAEDADE